MLNSNSENPYLIWDNRTRAELTKYLEEQQQSIIRTVSQPAACLSRYPLPPPLPPPLSLSPPSQGDCDMSYGEDFRFTVFCNELVVGEIYVRVYNEQPTYVLEVGRGVGVASVGVGVACVGVGVARVC